MVALLAVFALLVQALIPSIANAAPSAGGEQVICTSHGLMTVAAGDTAPAKATTPCEQCVCPPVALQPPATIEPVALVTYARETAPQAVRADLPPPARAPPRPLGQGPPISNA